MHKTALRTFKPHFAAAIMAITLAFGAGAAAEARTPTPPPDTPVSSQAGQPSRLMPTDEIWSQAEARLPGFGGIFLDGNVLNVYMLEPVNPSEVEPVITDLYGEGVIPAGGIKVIPGQYSIKQLWAWQQSGLINLPGVVSIGVSEAENRLSIGVVDEASKAEATAKIAQLGIPSAAVILEVTGQIMDLGGSMEIGRPQTMELAAAGQMDTTRDIASDAVTTLSADSQSAPDRMPSILAGIMALGALALLFLFKRRRTA